jgi:nitrite reductase/ring-hydroxylating ferredoxin subunit
MTDKRMAVAATVDLKDGEMRQVSVDGTEVLLALVHGAYHAVAAHCTHYGAPLVDGVLSGDRLVCPWHHACFNVGTGDLEEPPAFDALPSYDVQIENDQVFVSLPEERTDRRTPQMAKRDPNDERLFVIAGGGAAGYVAAQTLREDGFKGRIVLLTRENRAPYDRPNLSKEYLQGKQKRSGCHFDLINSSLSTISRSGWGRRSNRLTQSRNQSDSLMAKRSIVRRWLATGGEPRKLRLQSAEQFSESENVFLLRSFGHSDAIIAAAEKGKRVAVIGASFIGMEVAASLTARGCVVTVVAPGEAPFQKILGLEIGRLFQSIHEENGVNGSERWLRSKN